MVPAKANSKSNSVHLLEDLMIRESHLLKKHVLSAQIVLATRDTNVPSWSPQTSMEDHRQGVCATSGGVWCCGSL